MGHEEFVNKTFYRKLYIEASIKCLLNCIYGGNSMWIVYQFVSCVCKKWTQAYHVK